MLASTIYITFLVAMAIYLKYQYSNIISTFYYISDLVVPFSKDILFASQAIPVMEEIMKPTTMAWSPLRFEKESNYYVEMSLDYDAISDFIDVCVLVSGAVIVIIFYFNQNRQQPPLRRPPDPPRIIRPIRRARRYASPPPPYHSITPPPPPYSMGSPPPYSR